MQVRLMQFSKILSKRNPKPLRCEMGPERAVTIGQLMELWTFFVDFIKDRNAYYLDPNIIRPLTKPFQMSMSEVFGPRRVDFFVSHFWGTSTQHFVETLEIHAKATRTELLSESSDGPDWSSLAYWICFLSNSQWHIDAELGHGDWWQSSFYKALRSGFVRATCMILDEQALPLTRSWCLFEVLQTYVLLHEKVFDNFDGLQFSTDRGTIGKASDAGSCYDIALALGSRIAALNVEDATATNKKDEAMIIKLVEENGGMATMNEFLRNNMVTDLQNARHHFINKVDELDSRLTTRSVANEVEYVSV
jgi:hypothetical protein